MVDMMGGIPAWRGENGTLRDARSGAERLAEGLGMVSWLYLQLEKHSRSKTSLRVGAFDAFRDWKP
jgi:hypothetical protein